MVFRPCDHRAPRFASRHGSLIFIDFQMMSTRETRLFGYRWPKKMTRKESWFPIFGLTVHGATKTSPAFLMRTHWNRHGQWVTSSLLACQLNKGTRCFGWRDYSSVCDTGSFVVRSSRHLSFNERILLNPPSQLPCPQPPNFCKHERIRREGMK